MAGDADLGHEHRSGGADVDVEEGARYLDHGLPRIAAQGRQGTTFESVQVVPRPALERQVGDEAVADRTVGGADAVAELDGERRRNRDAAGDLAVAVRRLDGALGIEDAADDLLGVLAAHLVDDAADLAGLDPQHAFGEVAQVEP